MPIKTDDPRVDFRLRYFQLAAKRSLLIFSYVIGDPARILTGAWERSRNNPVCIFRSSGDLVDPPWDPSWEDAFEALEGKLCRKTMDPFPLEKEQA